MEQECVDDCESAVSQVAVDDLESKLLEQFRIMGTNDRDVLIGEFQKLLGGGQNYMTCQFFLEMNNWNLQDAVCSYYDYEQVNSSIYRLPSVTVLKDTTIGEGESVAPLSRFVKRWEIKNTGQDAWPPGCCLKYVGGCQFGVRDRIMVECLEPFRTCTISLELTSPDKTGYYQGQWRMCTGTGLYFGDIIWVVVQVEENGLMAVTQQLAQIGNSAASVNQLMAGDCDMAVNSLPQHVLGLSQTPTVTPVGSPVQNLLLPQSQSYPGSPLQHYNTHSVSTAASSACRELFQGHSKAQADEVQDDMDSS